MKKQNHSMGSSREDMLYTHAIQHIPDFQGKGPFMMFQHNYWTLDFDAIETYRWVEKKSDFGKTEYELHVQLASMEEWTLWNQMEQHWEKEMKEFVTSSSKKKETILLMRMTNADEPGWIRIRIPRTTNHWFQCSHIEVDGEKQEYMHMHTLFQQPWKRIQLTLEWKGYTQSKALLQNRWMVLQWKVLNFSGILKELE